MHGRARGKPEGFAGLPYRGRVATVRHGLRDVLQRLALTFGQLLDHCTSTFGLSPAIERLFASEYRAGYRHARTCVRFPALTRTYVRRSIEHAFDLGRGKLSHRLISVRRSFWRTRSPTMAIAGEQLVVRSPGLAVVPGAPACRRRRPRARTRRRRALACL